jgi:prepilin peptidase CpaA
MVRPDHLPILGVLLAVACASDLAARRVPNAVAVAIAVAGIGAQWAGGGVGAAAGATAGAAALLGLLAAAWTSGKLGGGDVKLAAATAIWLGPSSLVAFALFTAMAGAPVALATIAARGIARRRVLALAPAGDRSLRPLEPAPRTVPLSVAIALGAAAVLWGVR